MDPLVVFALLGFGMATLALFNGIVSMAHGGPQDAQMSHRLMFKRVAWQAVAVLSILLALLGHVG
jgi:hypothetical protein